MSYKRVSPQPIIEGGTGLSAVTSHNLMIGNGTSALNLLAPSSTSGIALVSNGSSSDPHYSTVAVAGGGTGTTSLTAHNLLVGGGTFLSFLSGIGTTGLPLVSNGASSDPSYQNISVPGGGTGITSWTTYAPICAGTTSTGSLYAASTGMSNSGYVLTSNGSSSYPTWQAAGSGGITTIDGDSGSVTGSTITLTGGSSGAVFTGSSATMTQSFNYLALPATTSSNGQVVINSSSFMHAYGTYNTFLGQVAGNFSLTGNENVGIGTGAFNNLSSGSANTAVGAGAMQNGAVSSNYNTAVGRQCMVSFVSGTANTAIGSNSLYGSQADSSNGAFGFQALELLNGGSNNNAVGANSLQHLATGNYNSCLGDSSGASYTGSESNNICINSGGTASESNVLRIGSATGSSTQQLNKAFICGIQGITVTGSAVLVSSSDQLGIAVSSARYKDNIADMNDVSSPILSLRPVTFNYKVGEDQSEQTGLIAEEVNEIMPSLVIYDKEGLPQTVKYHELPVLLLNELQKALKRIEVLEQQLIK